jgi:ferredoxin
LTLAVKNLYGCISGLHKSQLHINYPQPKNFVEILLKLNGMVKPSLNIIDGILAMEGAGPSKKGTPRKLNVIILSDNALYADFAVGRLLNIKDDAHPLIKAAKERGMLDEKELEIISDAGNFPLARDFVLPSPSILNNIPGGAVNILKAILKFYPRINFEKCVSCGACGTVCPKKAITTIKGKAVIDYKECISCLCCAEMCRFAAIDLKKSFLVRIILLLQMFSKSIVTGLAGLWRRKDARDKIQK